MEKMYTIEVNNGELLMLRSQIELLRREVNNSTDYEYSEGMRECVKGLQEKLEKAAKA